MVTATVSGMGTLSTKKKTDHAEGGGEGGAEDGAYGGTWATSNGENEPDSVEAIDTLFLKELRVKAKVDTGVGGWGGAGGVRCALK